jgi:hypothetical protein
VGMTESGGITESGEGSLADLVLRCAGTGRISDSADELRSRDTSLESSEVAEGRRGEFALIS